MKFSFLHFFKRKIPLITLLIPAIFACKKQMPNDPPEEQNVSLPELTHEGKNTFGCLLNGEPFVASVDYAFGGPTAVWAEFVEDQRYFSIQGTREFENDDLDNVSLKAFITDGEGSYEIFFTTDEYKGYTGVGGSIGCSYYHDLDNKGTVEITYLNMETNIVSGRFEMDLINPDCPSGTVLEVTEGRFDVKY